MKILLLFLISILFGHFIKVNAQVKGSTTTRDLVKKLIIPTTIIGVGTLVNKSQFEKDLQEDLRNKTGNDFRSYIDDYIQYAPIAQLYIADAMGVKSKNNWFNQTKYLFISQVITSAIVHTIKNTIEKKRPYGAPYSFPSGHTSVAFTNASVLFQEFRQTAPVLAYSGYVFSTTTGVFRMMNNKHWLSDVLVGASIGILVTKLVYHFEPLKNFEPFKKSDNISLYPQISDRNLGVYFSCKF